MRVRVKGRIINFAYTVLIKCAKSIAKKYDVGIETALSLIPNTDHEIYWTRKDMKRIAAKLVDLDDYYYQAKRMLPVLSFYGDCITHVNKAYTRRLNCACIEEKTKKLLGLSALDLYYVKKLLTLDSRGLAEES